MDAGQSLGLGLSAVTILGGSAVFLGTRLVSFTTQFVKLTTAVESLDESVTTIADDHRAMRIEVTANSNAIIELRGSVAAIKRAQELDEEYSILRRLQRRSDAERAMDGSTPLKYQEDG